MNIRGWFASLVCLLSAFPTPTQAEIIPLPNSSFEGPATVFADPRIDGWQEIPKPFWFPQPDESWDQLTGVFLNTTNGSPDHIDNIDGNQALFLTAVPGVGIFQDYNSFDWSSTNASHAFDSKFEPGKSYRLTVGLIGGGGNMIEGASVLLSLYYRDAASNMVAIASSNVVFSRALFPTTTHFIDQQVELSTVKHNDAWAGKNIGVMLASSIIDTNFVGGYWDLDNVRLESFQKEILIPNASFEGPTTVFADPRVDSWQEIPKPFWFPQPDESWDQLIGVFLNTTNGSPDHIDNIDGNQALFLTAVPGVGIFQDYESFDWSSTNASRALDATFQAGNSYQLTVSLIGGGGNMIEGASVLLSLYYRDAASNMVTVASSNVVFSGAVFTNTNHFIDQRVHLPTVRPSDHWAGENIGIMIASSIVDTNFVGGYWDIDNVRLTVNATPELKLSFSSTSEGLQLVWPTQAGFNYQVRIAEIIGAWTNYQTPLSGTGASLSLTIPRNQARAFFQVVATPQP